MSDENVDYTSFSSEPEPETIDELAEQTNAPDPEAYFKAVETVDDALEVIKEELEEIHDAVESAEPVVAPAVPAGETNPLIFVPTVPDGRHLNIRKNPDGDIMMKVTNEQLLYCIEDGPIWAWVEFMAPDGGMVRGYAKKDFLVIAGE